jgi:glycerol uptake facilitator-like aquaporin
LSEFLGTAFLLATVVGSGYLLHGLDQGNVAITVFGIALATGLTLFALIATLGSISAQFNPVVSLVNTIQGILPRRQFLPFVLAQVAGATFGVVIANLMFDGQAISISTQTRAGTGQWLSEVVSTFGLIGVILGCGRAKPDSVAPAVSAYVASAIMFTSSTCFANPAVSIARVFTSSLTGISPYDVAAFIAFEIFGALCALAFFSFLFKGAEKTEESAEPTAIIGRTRSGDSHRTGRRSRKKAKATARS